MRRSRASWPCVSPAARARTCVRRTCRSAGWSSGHASRSNRSAPARPGSCGGSVWMWRCPGRSGCGCARAGPRRGRSITPDRSELFRRLPRVTEPAGESRGTVALLSGCVQDRWFREVNRATIRVLAMNGWRVEVPRAQACCGALAAHNGRLDTARRLAERNLRAFAGVDVVVTNAAGCVAHLQQLGDLIATDEARAFSMKVRDVMQLLHDGGFARPPGGRSGDRSEGGRV